MHAVPPVRRTLAALCAAGSALLASACSESPDAAVAATPVATTPALAATPAATPGLAATTAAPSVDSQPAAARPLGIGTRRHLTGRRGTYTWDLTYPQFTTGAAAAEANRRLRAMLDTAVAAWASGITAPGEPASKDPRRLTGEARVSVNDGRTLQVKLGTYHFVTGAAHGITSVYTTALDVTVARPRPLLLRGLVRDPATAYPAFAREVTRQVEADGASVEPDAVAAKDATWAAWQATAKGLEFSFGSYQLGAFPAADLTVPWSVARPLLTPDAYRLLGPVAQR